jgi:uncharacterized coiled-coil DUF342 family protein
MNELTPEQAQQIASWVSQRDAILADIANLRTEQHKLTLSNQGLAESNTDIETRINKGLGRIEELDKKEKEYEEIISTKLSDSLVQSSQLQSEITGLTREIGLLFSQKETLVDLVLNLTSIHNKLSESAVETEKMIGAVTQVNSDNAKELQNLLIEVKNQVKQIIDVNESNVAKTNVVINDLPKIIFDLQRELFERKQFNRIKQQ